MKAADRPFYNSARWIARRRDQLARHPLCAFCLAHDGRVTAATVADHVVPHRGSAQSFFEGELQSLCAPCHSARKQQIETTGFMRGFALDGSPLDPAHPWNQTGKKR